MMATRGALIGGGVGLVVAGPVGAVVGAAVGASIGRKRDAGAQLVGPSGVPANPGGNLPRPNPLDRLRPDGGSDTQQQDQTFHEAEKVTSPIPVVGSVLQLENAIGDWARGALGLGGDPFWWVTALRQAAQNKDIELWNDILDIDPNSLNNPLERGLLVSFKQAVQAKGLWDPKEAAARNLIRAPGYLLDQRAAAAKSKPIEGGIYAPLVKGWIL